MQGSAIRGLPVLTKISAAAVDRLPRSMERIACGPGFVNEAVHDRLDFAKYASRDCAGRHAERLAGFLERRDFFGFGAGASRCKAFRAARANSRAMVESIVGFGFGHPVLEAERLAYVSLRPSPVIVAGGVAADRP